MSFVAALAGSYNDNNNVVDNIVTRSGSPSTKRTTWDLERGKGFVYMGFFLTTSKL